LYAELSSTALPPNEAMPKAKESALEALALDASLTEARISLALISWWSDWDFPAAEREFKRAIELNPYEPEVYNDYCNYLVRLGRVDEALRAANRAIELDSASLSNNRYLALIFYYAHQYDRAIEQALRTLEIDQSYDRARHILGAAYLQKGLREQAIIELQKAANLPPGEQASMLGYAYAVAGRRGEAVGTATQMQTLSRRRYISPYQIARIYAGLGDKKLAFVWLEKAYEGRSDFLTRMKVDPTFESLYDDPRFINLARRVGLP
jgi:tetratricopeptide (TPR) repeat protein